ncbi:MAG: hypothetical protein O7H41_02715 [Planctomycetota bacterium]|nr:hypothetical protein [Planctomycetota bacterium]
MPRFPIGLLSLLLLFLCAAVVTWNGAIKELQESSALIKAIMSRGRIRVPADALTRICDSVSAFRWYYAAWVFSCGGFLGIVGVFIYRFVVYRLRGPEARSQASGGGMESGKPNSIEPLAGKSPVEEE